MFSKVLRRITSPIITRLRLLDRAARQAKEDRPPKTALSHKHMDNCRVLVDRRHLLEMLPHNAIVAEIGVDKGEFSAEILSVAKPKTLHLVDLWDSDRFHEGKLHLVMQRLEAECREGVVRIHRKSSFEAAEDFSDRYFDWIYIDTDHSYKTTRRELELYAPKMKPGGIIAGHDFAEGNWTSGIRYGVVEAVREFCFQSGWEFVFVTTDPSESLSFAIRKSPMENA